MSGSGKASTVAPQAAKVGPTTTTASSSVAGGGAKERSDPGARTGIPTRPTTTPGRRSSADAPVPEWKIRCLCSDRSAVSAVMIGGLGCF